MFATNGHAVAALYLAYFNRPADPEGLKYWTAQLDGGASFLDIARGFASTAEANTLYPDLANGDPDAFVTSIFHHLFLRWPSASDSEYWTTYIENGKPAWQALVDALQSARNEDAVHIGKALEASLAITQWVEQSGQPHDAATVKWLMNHASVSDNPLSIVNNHFDPPVTGGGASPVYDFIIGFDDWNFTNTLQYELIRSVYKNMTWNNFSVVHTDNIQRDYPGSGYTTGLVSGDTVAYSGSVVPAILSASKTFDLESLFLTAAWNDGLVVTVEGFKGGNSTGIQTLTANTTSYAFFKMDDAIFNEVDSVEFVSFGGTLNTVLGGSGIHFVLDDIRIIGLDPTPPVI